LLGWEGCRYQLETPRIVAAAVVERGEEEAELAREPVA